MILQHDMLFLPLPILAALLCAMIAPMMLRLDLGRRASAYLFFFLFADFALQSLLVGLRFGYGVERFIIFQRVLPMTVGPLVYLGFAALTGPKNSFTRIAWAHLGVAIAVSAVLAIFARRFPEFDPIISASYLIYAVLLGRLAHRGADYLIHARLEIADAIRRWAWSGVCLLGLLLALDTAIAVNFALNQGDQAALMVSFGSVLLIGLLLLILVKLPMAINATPARMPISDRDAPSAEDALAQRAKEMLLSSQVFLDPDLTVQRLARRLVVPERHLSAAINQSQGMNVSQYVNQFRLEHAASLLQQSNESVAKIMAQSGFLTRSNFYREFQRVYGMSPAKYRASADSK